MASKNSSFEFIIQLVLSNINLRKYIMPQYLKHLQQISQKKTHKTRKTKEALDRLIAEVVVWRDGDGVGSSARNEERSWGLSENSRSLTEKRETELQIGPKKPVVRRDYKIL